MQIEYCGRIYDENTDFVALLQAAARNEFIPGLRDDLAYWSGLGALHEALMGTPAGQRLAEAALTIMETGTPDEFCLVQGLAYERESGIPARMLSFIEQHADRIPRTIRGIGSFLRNLLDALPAHPAAINFLRRECERSDANSEAPSLSARLDTNWFLARLPDFLRGESAGERLDCFYSVPPAQKHQFLEIVAASGTKNIEAVVREHLELWRGNEADFRYEAVLNSHPAFAEALLRLRQPPR